MADDNPYDYGDMLDGAVAVPATSMSQLSELAQLLLARKKTVSQFEAALKSAEKDLAEIEEQRLPEAMGELGLKSFTTKEGLTIKVETTVRASASAKKDPEKFQALLDWLQANGHAGLEKNEITVQIARGREAVAVETIALLKKQGLSPTQETTIHASTLSAFVRERLEACDEIPEDLFGVYRQTVAKVSV